MDRRTLVRVLGGALALPALQGLTADEALALGMRLHGAPAAGGARRLGTFTEHQHRTMDAVAEAILPETDTPGARAARVADFVDALLTDWYDEPDRRRLLEGITLVDARSRAAHGQAFVDLEPERQAALVGALDDEVAALREAGQATGDHFFQQMKWLTVFGYYTSEVGVREELRWSPMPAGGYDPCRPFTPRSAEAR